MTSELSKIVIAIGAVIVVGCGGTAMVDGEGGDVGLGGAGGGGGGVGDSWVRHYNALWPATVCADVMPSGSGLLPSGWNHVEIPWRAEGSIAAP